MAAALSCGVGVLADAAREPFFLSCGNSLGHHPWVASHGGSFPPNAVDSRVTVSLLVPFLLEGQDVRPFVGADGRVKQRFPGGDEDEAVDVLEGDV